MTDEPRKVFEWIEESDLELVGHEMKASDEHVEEEGS